jgi:hypothetical protein
MDSTSELLIALHAKSVAVLRATWGTTEPERLRDLGADSRSVDLAQTLSIVAGVINRKMPAHVPASLSIVPGEYARYLADPNLDPRD